jgi:hypothetical protein
LVAISLPLNLLEQQTDGLLFDAHYKFIFENFNCHVLKYPILVVVGNALLHGQKDVLYLDGLFIIE